MVSRCGIRIFLVVIWLATCESYTLLQHLSKQTAALQQGLTLAYQRGDLGSHYLNRIGFTAYTTTNARYSQYRTIQFQHVVTNAGLGYDPTNGMFRAPVTGYYVFFWTIRPYSTRGALTALNGASYQRSYCRYGSNYLETCSQMFIRHVTKGSYVYIRSKQSYSDVGGTYSLFGGYKI